MTSHEDYDYEVIGKAFVQLLEALKLTEKTTKGPPEEIEELPSDEELTVELVNFLTKRNGSTLISKLSAAISKETKEAITRDGRSIATFFRERPEIFSLSKKKGKQTVRLVKAAAPKEERAPHSLKATCKFFTSKKGCKWGDQCHRQHRTLEKKE